ncbi:DUF262 domain-containing protein [Mucilaginibacter sp. RCC_168]|uniref:GmrSD restriction endonuclease domain-containing protein n=1 Tax=Mucilaginibacter sp. RCC_168 TaxID=3239221 RepID=UPI003524685D
MIENTIGLMPVSELLGRCFFVPAYQRGYRWTERQVTDLLEDIYTFAKKTEKTPGEFYCLQPVVVKFDEEKNYYEVIDGQQRLTTIRILLVYLQKEHHHGQPLEKYYGKKLFKLVYETRPDLTLFLDNIIADETNIEFYHVYKSYDYISNWFAEKVQLGEMFYELCDTIIKTLVYNQKHNKQEGVVQVIWYEMHPGSTNAIDTFIRINLGKIPLTNAELIKALFLQERNFGSSEAARLMQLEIAQEWDNIENQLQDENFWWFLNRSGNSASSHIEFIFDIMQTDIVGENKELDKEIGNDKDRTFRFFSKLFGNEPDYEVIKANWDRVKEYFATFKKWFDNPKWYHYIGFLIYTGKTVEEILKLLNQKNILTKEDADRELIDTIKKEFEHLDWEKVDDEYHLKVTYKEGSELLKRFFLLFNLEYIVRKAGQENLVYRFPFKAFKTLKKKREENNWDIEHINAATDNQLEKWEDQKTWLLNAIEDVKEMPEPLQTTIRHFLSVANGEGFESLHEQVLLVSGETNMEEKLKHSLGNLTLLDAGTNRGYGNALFTSKRRIIIEKDKAGTFVPICTKHVFLKYFDGNPKATWTEDDVKAYRNALEDTMSVFLNPKPHENA